VAKKVENGGNVSKPSLPPGPHGEAERMKAHEESCLPVIISTFSG
jgi:hypothetical protein